ncbi:acetyltransferase [Clostridium sp. B9]|uniref:acetyltransferase n=1 Tax=Clostridium sp. B9 TaxID=3423224 RepID=UPI003D2EE45E
MKSVIIIGTGTIAREVIRIIENINSKRETWKIVGLVSTTNEIEEENVEGYRVISMIDSIYNYFDNKKKDRFNFFKKLESENELYVSVAIDNYEIKKDIVTKLNGKVKFATIVHPDINYMEKNKIGEGSIVYPGMINVGFFDVGKHVIIKQRVSLGNNVKIGDYAFVSLNSNIDSNVIIDDGVYIEANTTILANNKIDKETYIKTGSLIF